MRRFFALVLAILTLASSCKKEIPHSVYYGGVDPDADPSGPVDPDPSHDGLLPPSNPDAVPYGDLVDQVHDAGQFYIPQNSIKPKGHWYVVHTDYNNRENPSLNSNPGSGLQGYLLMHSVVGLINKAAIEGKIDYCAWMEKGNKGYDTERALLGKEIGRQNALELAINGYGKWEGIDVEPKKLFEGYVLTDLENNPESGNIAAVASHVYNSLIVDVKNEQYFKDAGYELKCDCRSMTLRQAFDQFKDKCNNNALVLMPVGVKGRIDIAAGEHRDYAIANKLFVANIVGGKSSNGTLFADIMKWLEPGSQVIGWENNDKLGEDAFVDPVSQYGSMMLAADWAYNLTTMSRDYVNRQPYTLAKTINPRSINYDKTGNYISFFLTDGDNYQFIIEDNFVVNYYSLRSSSTTKTAFELGTQSLIQLAPTRFTYLMEQQPSPECTIMETFGGGYYYIDTYATRGFTTAERKALIKKVAERTAAHMRQHGIKVLHVMARDFDSENGQEMLQAFVDANDQLEGITGVEYSPYTGGQGKVYWFTNKAGYDIPLITTKYMLWDKISSPSYAAGLANASESAQQQTFSTVAIHAWSDFDGNHASDAAQLMINGLESRFNVVSVQELIWRLRMAERQEQTQEFLATIK